MGKAWCRADQNDMTKFDPKNVSSSQGTTVLHVENLSKSFGQSTVLRGVSFDLHENEILGVIGPSGGGKTTLLKCLNLLERFDGGSITFQQKLKVFAGGDGTLKTIGGSAEEFLTEVALNGVRREVGLVFQSFNLWDEKTVVENLTLGPIVVLQQRPELAEETASKLCQQFGLQEKLHSRVWQLSGGQRQRVAIIRALMMSPKIILLDEITSALDPVLTAEVLQAIRQLRDQGLAMLLVTHHIEFASTLCDRIMFLSHGQILQLDTPTNLRQNPASEEVKSFLETLRAIQ